MMNNYAITQTAPGPWKIELESETPNASKITIVYSDGELRSHIAVLHDATLCPEHGELFANARLIAKAPLLVEARDMIANIEAELSMLREMVFDLHLEPDLSLLQARNEFSKETIRAARALLAKLEE